jgi:hypothetical protein
VTTTETPVSERHPDANMRTGLLANAAAIAQKNRAHRKCSKKSRTSHWFISSKHSALRVLLRIQQCQFYCKTRSK